MWNKQFSSPLLFITNREPLRRERGIHTGIQGNPSEGGNQKLKYKKRLVEQQIKKLVPTLSLSIQPPRKQHIRKFRCK